MKKAFCLALAFVPLALAGCAHHDYAAYPPPPAYSEVAQQGFHDGVRAAQRDLHHGLPPAPERHREFDHPAVAPPLREDYRHGFRDGYERVFSGRPR